MTIEEQRDIYREETMRWKAALQTLEKENAELKAAFNCFKCGDGSTPLYCLNCANDELKQQLAEFHAAMDREKKPDWEKWLKDLADRLDGIAEFHNPKPLHEAARQLRYMADSFTLKANFVPIELRIKELEGNLAAAEKEHDDLIAKLEHGLRRITRTMKTPQEWCQELAFDFDAPRIDAKTIEFIQTDARADLIDRLQKAEQQLKEEVDLLRVSKCPNCDGSGSYPVEGPHGEAQECRCQFCFELNACLASQKDAK